jgi:hypothetical protein
VSSPIVWGDRVFVTSQAGRGARADGPGGTGDRVGFLIEAFSRTDGNRLWTHEVAAEGDLPPVHDKHNLASASPVTDGERVYAVFGTGQVVAVDTSGARAWTRHLAREFAPFDIQWGYGSSPVLYRDSLILVCFHPSASYLLALDRRTGKRLWKTERGQGVLSYSSPLIVPAPGGDELIVNSSEGVEAYSAATGEVLWRLEETNRFPIPSAVQDRGIIYLSRGYRSGPYAAIRPGGRGDISKTHVVWHVPAGAPYVSSIVLLARNQISARTLASPAISGGRLFMRTDDQLIAIGARAGS